VHRSQITIDLRALRRNVRTLLRQLDGAELWAVVKADGYGHGAKAVARTLERAGANGICVALLEEGIELRQAGIQVPILITGGYYGRAAGELLRHELTPVIHDPSQLEMLADEVRYSIVPVLIGEGMPFFGSLDKDVALHLVEVKAYASGMVALRHQVRK
jgi:alanine racemase